MQFQRRASDYRNHLQGTKWKQKPTWLMNIEVEGGAGGPIVARSQGHKERKVILLFVCDSVKIHNGECLVFIFNPWSIEARARQERVTRDYGLDILLDFGSTVGDSLLKEEQRYNSWKMSATEVLSPSPFMGLEMGRGFGREVA
ncbi:hypothetical protein AMTRI_Chr08g210570 [Amborella trichopoda]